MWKLSLLLLAVVLAVWAFWARLAPDVAEWVLNGASPQTAAAWGDSFGALNAFFGALGFAAVVTTLFLQGQALRQQQRDQHLQRFETTFFQLLALMRELREDVVYRYSTRYREEKLESRMGAQKERGVSAISQAVTEIEYWRKKREYGSSPLGRKEIGDIYIDVVHKNYERQISPYFRIVYTILRRISEERALSSAERASYGNLLRSQLTSHEIALAAFNALTPVANNFYDLIVEFRLLKYLPDGTLRKTLSRYYPKEAFEARD